MLSLGQFQKDDDYERMATQMYPNIGSLFTIVTGGAVGADVLAEECAKEWGMNVSLCLTPHHHRALDDKVTPIAHDNLNKCLFFVERARQRLKRHPTKNPFVRDLLARNWFIVDRCDVLFAYAKFEDDSLTNVEGGTGMTVQMCVDHNRDYPDEWKGVFVFDESRQKWYELEREDMRDPDDEDVTFSDTLGPLAFRECMCSPILYKSSGVVGSRTLGVLGRYTMKQQFRRTMKTFSRHEMTESQLREEVEKLREMFQSMSIRDRKRSDQSHVSSGCVCVCVCVCKKRLL